MPTGSFSLGIIEELSNPLERGGRASFVRAAEATSNLSGRDAHP